VGVQRKLSAEEKRLTIEWKKLWKHIIFVMVVTRRNHQSDYFNQFLFEARDGLRSDAGVIASRANRRFGLNLTGR
jgi:hypothetical protein